MDERKNNLVEEIIEDAKDGILNDISWLDLIAGLGYGAAAFFIVTLGYIQHQADKKATIKLLMNNKEEK